MRNQQDQINKDLNEEVKKQKEDSINLLNSLESEQLDSHDDILEKAEIETALAVGKNKKLNKDHVKSRNKSISGAKIVGKIKYKGGRRKKKKKTRRKRGKGTVQSRKKKKKRRRRTTYTKITKQILHWNK